MFAAPTSIVLMLLVVILSQASESPDLRTSEEASLFASSKLRNEARSSVVPRKVIPRNSGLSAGFRRKEIRFNAKSY